MLAGFALSSLPEGDYEGWVIWPFLAYTLFVTILLTRSAITAVKEKVSKIPQTPDQELSTAVTANHQADLGGITDSVAGTQPLTPAADGREMDHLLSHLEREEKFVLLMGLIALYGDGEFSAEEILEFRELISALKFSPKSLSHRDPNDEDLCLDETVVWALDLMRESFVEISGIREEDIERLVEVTSKSLREDIDALFSDDRSKLKYLGGISSALWSIANADGRVSAKEEKLINIVRHSNRHERLSKKVFISQFNALRKNIGLGPAIRKTVAIYLNVKWSSFRRKVKS